MSFIPLNNLNGSSKSNATATACSTNSLSLSNLNIDDIDTGNKSNLNIDCTASGSKSEDNRSIFVFGNPEQKKKSDSKTSEGFNFVFNSSSFDSSSSEPNTELKVVKATSVKFATNSFFDSNDKMAANLDDKTKAGLDSDNNNENPTENSHENSVKDEQLNNQVQKQDADAPNVEMMVVQTLVKEFKDVISNFVEERVEGERKIAALEGRIVMLEKEIQNLKYADSKESAPASVTNNNNTAKSVASSVSQPPLVQPPTPSISLPTASPVVSLPSEPPTPKKNAFGFSSSLFSLNATPVFNGTSTSTFGSLASSVHSNGSATSSSFGLGTSAFSSNALAQGGSTLFGASAQTSNQNGINSEPEPKKLFSDEAVTSFLNAQKDPGLNSSLTKVNTGNCLKKITIGSESSEPNQNAISKENFQINLQKTIEMSVKKFVEEFWDNSKTSENYFKKLNNGNMF